MKISITEYNNGGGQHIAGTIAEADNLGIATGAAAECYAIALLRRMTRSSRCTSKSSRVSCLAS